MNKIITHLISGYPGREESLEVAKGLIAGGAYALEMQIPFSDPSADGPIIENACRKTLERGWKIKDSWELIKSIRKESDIPIFVMSYASPVYAIGVKKFVYRAQSAGASGLIIPDLPPGMDEGLFRQAALSKINAVPVIVPSTGSLRIDDIITEDPKWIYVALRSGITGEYTPITHKQERFLVSLKNRCAKLQSKSHAAQIMAGFGIKTSGQVQALTKYADAAVIGSAIVETISNTDSGSIFEMCRKLAKELVNP